MKTNPDLSYCHGVGAQSLIGRTLSEQFDLIAAGRAKSEALVCASQKIRWTYEQLSERVDLFARGLLKLGIEVGDRVGIWSTNNAEWIVVQLATAKIGAILVNINPAYRTSELDYALRQSGVKMLVAMRGYKSDEYLAMLYELAPELMNSEVENPSPRLPDLRYIVVIDGRSVEQSESVINFDLLYDYGKEMPAKELSIRSAELQFDSPINIQYTSGTTGFPKGVTLTHHNLLNNALYSAQAMGVTETARFCVPLPFYHCGGMVLCTLVTLLVGGTLVIPNPTFDPGATLQVVAKEKCTHLAGVPTMFVSELDLPNFDDFDLSTLEGGFMAGAPCPVELMHQVTGRLHCSKLVIFYGQTECSPVITSTTVDDSLEVRATTVGRVIPHLEVKVIDSLTGAVLPRGQQGEICARGYAVMPGYWMNPAATEDSVDSSGWLHTGDLAVMSEEGLINITGRKKDMIIRGGENIYPREIEEVLHGHPEVAQAQVFGVPDKHFGEEVALWVQLKQDCHADGEQIKAWLKERVAHFKIPKYIKVVSEFPMTVTGKVQKHAMRDTMITELGLEAAAGIRTA